MSSFLAKLKNPLVLGYVVVVLLLLAGAVYVTIMYINGNNNNGDQSAGSTPKLVTTEKVQTSLKSANDSAKAAYDAHTNTQAAFNEQQVTLGR